MTKEDLVLIIGYKTGIHKKDVKCIIDNFMQEIRCAMEKNQENVYLRNFGTFHLVKRKEKVARNIHNNTQLLIPMHNIPKFKPCKEFIKNVKNKMPLIK